MREEIPVLDFYRARPDAVEVVRVDARDRLADALALMAELDPRYPPLLDPDNALQSALAAPPVLLTSWVPRPTARSSASATPLVFRDPGQVAAAVEAALTAP